ncbi:AMIN domain-containing protein [Leptolyngbya sp. AN02str]|uniref:AMIN domain-containing protein n=1 Tax=Leptolyngbya sp. AN02str TaxID=3423363 RepID=UPI003D31B3DD
MRPLIGLTEFLGGGAIALVMALPAIAAPTQVTGVEVRPAAGGISVQLMTSDGDRPQVFTVSQGNALVADFTNAQLRLPDGNGYLQANPAPGVAMVMVNQLDATTVRVTVAGQTAPPVGQISQDANRIVMSVNTGGAAGGPTDGAIAQLPPPSNVPPPNVMVPNPQVTIDGVPVAPSGTPGALGLPGSGPSGVPPLLPRAIAPPVGDIAVSSGDFSPSIVNLGTSERVPRLVLRNAPVRDVLSLLGRAAGINVAYIGDAPPADPQATQSGTPDANRPQDIRISLDIENEPVQNVFNYVLRIAGLEANLTGRTVFVGPRLPNSARNLVVRTLRLNQVTLGPALNFLVGLGAETAVSRERLVTSVNAVGVQAAEGTSTSPITQTQTTTEERIEVQRVAYQDSEPLLRGLQVTGDERTNSVTLVGTPQLVELATSQLVNLDVRRRQVAVNVRVIDVNLLETGNVGSSFGFGIGDFGIDVLSGLAPDGIGVGFDERFATSPFVARLNAAITNGNAKILTDPTLVIQEGQTAEVALTQDVITNFTREVTVSEGVATISIQAERLPAGLVLEVQVDRIDDNGFISLSVAPSVTAVADTQTIEIDDSENTITLLQSRRLSSGQVRVRDGQTLVLSGIIQDADRVEVSKVPILGDIPLLGALFRRTERTNERNEVIVVLTPQIINDSDQSSFGYRYVPGSRDTQNLIERGRP